MNIEEVKETNDKLDQIGQAIVAGQKASEKKFAGYEDNVRSTGEEITKLGAELQKAKEKEIVMQKSIDILAKQMARGVGSNDKGDDTLSDIELEYKEKFSDYLRYDTTFDNTSAKELNRMAVMKTLKHVSKDKIDMVAKSMVEGINPQGGYFIRPQLLAQMITRVFETSPMRAHATVIPMASPFIEMIINDQQAESGGFVGEIQTRAETDTANLGVQRFTAHEQFAIPKASNWMLEDSSIDIENFIVNKGIDIITRTENTAFVTGNGSQRPRGFLTFDDYTVAEVNDPNGAYGRDHIQQISSGSAGNITSDGIKELQNNLKELYQPNAKWFIRRIGFQQITTLKDAQGRFIFNTRFLQEARTLQLLGQEVVFFNDLPNPATDSLSLCYGDMQQTYIIGDRIGITILRDPFTAADNGFVKFRMRKRVAGGVWNFESLKILRLSA